MATQIESSIVRIRKPDGTVVGAGFLVRERYVLTCAHVVAQALSISQFDPEKPEEDILLDFPTVEPGETLKARVVIWREVQEDETAPPPEDGEDIAVLKLTSSPPADAKPARLLSKNNLEGHHFEAFGFPNGHDNGVWASGVLCRRQGAGWVQIEAEKEPGFRIEPGFSGTPIWDKQLKGVVGIAVAADLERVEAKVAFMIPTTQLVKAWYQLGEWTIPPLIPSGKEALRFSRTSFWVLASLFFISSLGGVVFFTLPVFRRYRLEEPECVRLAHEQKKVLIIVADFAQHGKQILSNDRNLENRIRQELARKIPKYAAVCRFYNHEISDPDSAKEVARAWHALIVVWASEGEVDFLGGVAVTDWDQPGYLLPDVTSAEVRSSYTFRTKTLPELISMLSILVLSQTLCSEGKIEEARETLSTFLEQANIEKLERDSPDDLAQVYLFYGSLLETQPNPDIQRALQAYKEAYRLDTKLYVALFKVGKSYEQLKQPTQAIEAYSQLIEQKSNLVSKSKLVATALVNRANLLYEYQSDLEAAERDLNRAIDFDQKEGYWARANARLNWWKDPVGAVEDLEIVRTLEPKNPIVYRILGLTQLQANQPNAAKQTYQNALPYLNLEVRDSMLRDLKLILKKKPELAIIISEINNMLQQYPIPYNNN